jgi:uncharacterized membrane protein
MNDGFACFLIVVLLVNFVLSIRALFVAKSHTWRVDDLVQQIRNLEQRLRIIALDQKIITDILENAQRSKAPASEATPPAETAPESTPPVSPPLDAAPSQPAPPPVAATQHRPRPVETPWREIADQRPPAPAPPPVDPRPLPPRNLPITPPTEPLPQAPAEPARSPADLWPSSPMQDAMNRVRQRTQSLSSEQLLVRGFVLIGGVALALAGMYFVKWSYDKGLLRPEIRLSLGAAFGILLIGAGQWLHHRSARVAQSAVAAGVAVLFAVILAAHHVEELLPSTATFALLASITAAAVALSMRHGPFVAILGLLGGFATPALVGSNTHATASLFTYLIILQLGLMVVIRRRGWWWLSLLSLVGGTGWAAVWMLFNYQSGDSVWLGLYLLLVGITSIWNAGELSPADPAGSLNPLDITWSARTALAWLGGLLSIGLAAALLPVGGFTALEWAYFGLLGVGLLAVGRCNEQRAALAVVGAGVSVLLILGWMNKGVPATQDATFASVLIGAGAIYGMGGYACAFGSRIKLTWGLMATLPVALWLMGWHHFDARLSDHAWFAMCLGLAATYAALAWPWIARRGSDRGVEWIVSALVCTTCFFLAMAAPMELPARLFAVGWSVLALLIALCDMKLDIRALRIVMSLVGVAALGHLLLGFPLLAPPLGAMPVLNWILYALGVPTLAYAGVAWTLRRGGHAGLESLFTVLAGVSGFALITLQTRHGFRGERWLSSLLERGTLWEYGTYPTVWLIASAGGLALARQVRSNTLRIIAEMIAFIAIAFTLAVLCVGLNPLWCEFVVGSRPVLNVLLYSYGLPAALLLAIGLWQRRQPDKHLSIACLMGGFITLVVLVTLEVRQGFHGGLEPRDLRTLSTLWEWGTYPIAWLVAGCGIAWFGRRLDHRPTQVVGDLVVALSMAFTLVVLGLLLNPLQGQFDIGPTPVFNVLLYCYGIPAALMIGLGLLGQRQGRPHASLVTSAGLLVLLMLVSLEVRHGFRHGLREGDLRQLGSLWEWSTYPIAWLMTAAALWAAGHKLQSQPMRQFATGLASLALVFCTLGLCLALNPWWCEFRVGTRRLLNVLLYAYGTPAALTLAMGYLLRRRQRIKEGAVVTSIGLFLLFMLINLQVRQWFQGADLTWARATSNPERYAYSVAWIVLAGVLLVTGIATRSLMVRWASLIILLLTIGKTFIDTRDLKDLYRVASFLGLGLALLAVGYLYHRFVFRRDALLEAE